MKRLSVIALSATVVVLCAVGTAAWVQGRAETVTEVTGVKAIMGPIRSYINATGVAVARDEITVASVVSGRVLSLPVDVGQSVAPAQLLAVLDSADASNRLDTSQVAVRSSLLQVGAAERTLQVETRVWEAGGQARQVVDDARLNLQLMQAQHDRAQLDLDAAKAEVFKFRVTAARAGMVTSVEVRPGEFANAGAPLIRLSSMDKIELQLKVDQSEADRAKEGQAVEILDDSGAAVLGRSRLSRIEPKILKDGSSSYAIAWASLGDLKPTPRPNQQFSVRVLATSKESVLRLPLDAVTERDGVAFVRVIREGRLKMQAIKTGLQDDHSIEVLNGISAGEFVVLPNGRAVLKEGMLVRAA